MKKRITSLVFMILCAALTIICPTQIYASNYSEKLVFQTHSYEVFDMGYNWNEAVTFCEEIGGHMVTINSAEEDNQIYNWLKNNGYGSVMLGANCISGSWEWVTGEPFEYTNWQDGEPSGGGEAYLQYYSSFEDGKWNDTTNQSIPFVCEWDYVIDDSVQPFELVGSTKYYAATNTYQLTSLKDYDYGGMWFKNSYAGDFNIEFDFKTGGGTADSYGGADGFVFMFFAKKDYNQGAGEELGFIGCDGYGIEFDTFYNSNRNDSVNPHIALIRNSTENHLISTDSSKLEDNQWHKAKISAHGSTIEVFIDGEIVLSWDEIIEKNNPYFGFAATTGAGVNNHYIRNIILDAQVSQSTSAKAPVIKSAILSHSGKSYNMLDKVINIEKGSNVEKEIAIIVDNNGCENVEIYLTQGVSTSQQIPNNACAYIKPGEIFEANKDIYVIAVDTITGASSSKKTKLRIVQSSSGDWLPDSGVDGLNFKLGKNTGFTIPDSVPVVGGTDISWKFDFIPISVEYDKEDDNKVNIVFGTTILSEEYKKTENGKEVEKTYFKDFDFKKYKKDFKKAVNKQGRTLKQLKNDFKMTNINKMSLFKGNVLAGGSGSTDGDLDIIGYAEMKYIDGKWVFSEGQLALEAEISYTYQGQLFIWVVPCYYEFGGEIGAGIEGTMTNISPETFEPIFNAYLKAHLGANVGGGIGIAKVATVGASGSANFNIQTALHKEYLKSWVDGSADFKVKVFGKVVAEKNIGKGEFLIYETGNTSGLIQDGGISLMSVDNMLDSVDIDAVYENENRNYVSKPTTWLGDEDKVSLMAIDFSNKNLNKLAENVYTESAPQICNVGGTKVMVMQWDNPERDAINRAELRYSVYDDNTAKWSEPLAVYNDGTADFYPCFKNGYLVWQNQKAILTDEMTLEDIAALGEICVAKWNGNGFDTPVSLTDNSILETMPYIAVEDNNVSVLWITNSANDIMGISGENSIVVSDLSGNKTTLKSDLNAISSISAGYVDNKLAVSYVEDEDNDLSTIEDRDISIIYDGVQSKLTDNDVLDSNPVFAGDEIYYYSESNILYTDITGTNIQKIFDESTMGVTDNFTVNKNADGNVAVWWTKSDEMGTNIYTAFNDGAEWNRNIAITSLENQTKYPSGILNDDGAMLVVFNHGILENDEVVRTDLYTIELTPAYDIEISDAYIDEESMMIYATLTNVGELPISGFDLSVSDSGTVNNTVTNTDVLNPSDTVEVQLGFNKPDNMSLRTLDLSVVISEDEYNMDNNTFAISAGNADISVDNIDILEGGVYTISAEVSNIGYNNANNVTVALRENSSEGKIVDSQVMSLAVGNTENICFELNPDEIEFSDNRKQYYITAATDCNEITVGNNDANVFAVLYEVDDYEAEILNYNIIDGKTVINSVVKNNTDSKSKLNVYTAVYDTSGRLIGIDSHSFELASQDDIGVDATIEHSVVKDNIIKLFVWNDNLEPLVSVSPYTVK